MLFAFISIFAEFYRVRTNSQRSSQLCGERLFRLLVICPPQFELFIVFFSPSSRCLPFFRMLLEEVRFSVIKTLLLGYANFGVGICCLLFSGFQIPNAVLVIF
jgi:hypothetical protein